MSRADELKTFTVIGVSKSSERPGELFQCLDIACQACDAKSAAAIIHDLEATIAARDARIAELTQALSEVTLASTMEDAEAHLEES